MHHSPQEMMDAIRSMEEVGGDALRINQIRAGLDGAQIDYREAGATERQQGAIIMAAALSEVALKNPIFALFLKEEFMRTFVIVLAALK
jgi:hypothetical protein